MAQNGQLSYDNNILQELVICGNGIYIWDHLSSDKCWQNRDYLLRNNHNFVCARCHNGNEFSIDLMIFFISINTLTIVCNVTYTMRCLLLDVVISFVSDHQMSHVVFGKYTKYNHPIKTICYTFVIALTRKTNISPIRVHK